MEFVHQVWYIRPLLYNHTFFIINTSDINDAPTIPTELRKNFGARFFPFLVIFLPHVITKESINNNMVQIVNYNAVVE